MNNLWVRDVKTCLDCSDPKYIRHAGNDFQMKRKPGPLPSSHGHIIGAISFPDYLGALPGHGGRNASPGIEPGPLGLPSIVSPP